MKKIFSLLTVMLIFLGACDKPQTGSQTDIAPDKIYFFFSNSCSHCHHALDYLNKKYPNLEISMVNVNNQEGYNLFVKCARKFKLGNQIGTPLFCMGDNHIMGWSPEYEKQFDEYVKPFVK